MLKAHMKRTIVSKSGPCEQKLLFLLYPGAACSGATKQRETLHLTSISLFFFTSGWFPYGAIASKSDPPTKNTLCAVSRGRGYLRTDWGIIFAQNCWLFDHGVRSIFQTRDCGQLLHFRTRTFRSALKHPTPKEEKGFSRIFSSYNIFFRGRGWFSNPRNLPPVGASPRRLSQ